MHQGLATLSIDRGGGGLIASTCTSFGLINVLQVRLRPSPVRARASVESDAPMLQSKLRFKTSPDPNHVPRVSRKITRGC